MTVGNLVALHQTNLKRFLAYSSIAQAGYLMIGLAPGGYRGDASVAFYLLVYLVSCLASFGVAAIVAGATGREDMREYIGLSESNPRLAFVMMLSLFSLAGIPRRLRAFSGSSTSSPPRPRRAWPGSCSSAPSTPRSRSSTT
jgi:NADH-quinone oxidoreductase subunit N